MASLSFGTDGWRGLMAQEFTFANVRRAADALARAVPARSRIAVGYDHRFLSREFAVEAAGVLAERGHVPIFADGPTTSPALSYSLKALRAGAGVMITASHNPPNYNGLKVKVAPGCSADPAFTKRMEDIMNEWVPRPAVSDNPSKTAGFSPARDYLAHLVSRLDKKYWRGKKPFVAVDGMHGSGGPYWEALFGMLSLRGEKLRLSRDPLFGGVPPEPVDKNLAVLKKAVLEKKAAVGLAVDGDADRLGVVDDQGLYVPPHTVFPLLLWHLAQNRKLKGKVVQAVSLGYVSLRVAKKFGFDVVEVPVGFKHVADHMKKGKVILGGEESGGYGVGLWTPERDGLLTALLLLELVLASGKKLSELRKDMARDFGESHFSRVDYHLKAPVVDKALWVQTILKHLPSKLAGTPVRGTKTLDGLKIILEDDSWLLLRPSGTEPLLRTYAETPAAAKTAQLLSKAQEMAGMRGTAGEI